MSRPDAPGRGTAANPPNRYEPLHVELDPETDEDPEREAGQPPTIFYRDASRTILAENDSPDVGFRFSLNPYRGCEHGCVYCLGPETPVLHADMTWRPIGQVQVGDVLVGFDENAEPGKTRKLRRSIVEAVWWSRKPTLRLITEQTEVVTTKEHRWLQARDFRWSRTEQLSPAHRLRYVPVQVEEEIDDDYRVGYIAGLSLGDGTFRYEPGWRSNRLGFPTAYWRIALVDDEPLVRVIDHLRCFGVDAYMRPFSAAASNRKVLRKVEIRSLARLAIIHTLINAERDTRGYRRGFLAGFFDAEGYSGDCLRISQVDLSVLERVRRYASSLGFEFQLEVRAGCASTLRLTGRLVDRIRFFSVCRPAIARKMLALLGREMNLDPEPVRAVEPGARTDVVDIQTSTGTFLAAGLATHNCYARPTHEYLGFSAGLDFERRIMVKDNAPELLRQALASPRWEPQVVALSGNTDCYQPVERRLQITRRCLEVFAEFRNPVSAITKSALVARDADVFAELARHGAAHVMFSITSLDPELARRMEPRAARPERRLEAMAAVAKAGVPVAVMIGPVLPGLNDAEIPRILEAAARAGARSASWVLLRLPKPVDELFDRWLAENFPERRDRVLARIRDTRAGRISDSTFGRRQRGQGEYAEQIAALFAVAAKKHGLDQRLPPLETASFRRPVRAGEQMRLL
jgi:DNA repair photolyase